MTPFTRRGVPRSLQRDAWWIAADAQSGVGTAQQTKFPAKPFWSLITTVILADIMVWQTAGGLGFVALMLIMAGIIHWLNPAINTRRTTIAWVIMIASVLPAVDLVQPLSVGFALLGLATFAMLMIGGTADAIPRAIARLPFAGVSLNRQDALTVFKKRHALPGATQILRDWLMPLTLGLVFAALMILANPVVDRWLGKLLSFDIFYIKADRILFWIFAGLMVWPLYRLQKAAKRLFAPAASRRKPTGNIINHRSVARALILFNLIFAMQTVLDMTYLIGGAALPEGMTYATYAHRGAYPLLVTALLAGVFAIIAQPMLGEGRNLRVLLLIWVAQTVVLVASSILRLDLYIGVFGLTVFRVAAFIWMGVVAAGLCLLIWQISRRHTVSWFLPRAAVLGLATLYVTSFVNITGIVANHNLTRDIAMLDTFHLCYSGDGARPAIVAYNLKYDVDICGYVDTPITSPDDLREWGYRNYRLRSSVAAMKGATHEPSYLDR